MVQRFICVVSSKSISPQFRDRLRLNEVKNGTFTVKSSFDFLDRMLWNPHVPMKVVFFVWEVWLGKVLTMVD